MRRCCQGNVGGAQSRSEETARSQGAAGARRKTEGKWPPHTASGGPPADACGVALRATGPFSVRCRTISLKRAPAGAGRSRDRLKLRPQLLGGVRMAGLERLLARCPHPDAAAISPPRSFAAFAERRRWVGPHGNFFYSHPRPRRAKGAPRSRQAPTPAVRSLRVAHRRGGRLAAPLRNNMIRPRSTTCSSSYSDPVPTVIRPDPTVLEQRSAAAAPREFPDHVPPLIRP